MGFVKFIVTCQATLLVVTTVSAYGAALDSPEGHRLPPDPGKAGKKTLMGIDSDGDGLRDDIQRYIYFTHPDQANVQGALRQHAMALQKTLDPEREPGTGRGLAKEIGSSMDCVAYFAGDGFYNAVQLLKAKVVNTYKRTKQYLAYDKELSGGIFPGSRLPLRERYKHCDFELEPH